jgi:hypothetical protein
LGVVLIDFVDVPVFAPDLSERSLSQFISGGEGHLVDFKRAHVAAALPADHAAG